MDFEIQTRAAASELIFSESLTVVDATVLPRLRPVREVVRRYRGVRARVACLGETALQTESYLEFKAARVILACSAGAFVLGQPFHLVFVVNGTRSIYTPDFLVIGGEGPVAVEVKPDDLAVSEEALDRFRLIAELLQAHCIRFQIWRKSEIEIFPRWKSVLGLLPYRAVLIGPEDRGKVRKALRLRETCAALFPLARVALVEPEVVLRMILDGELFVDFNQPLTPDARVSATPFPNQLWPTPSQEGKL